jgi:hypothetical protein
VREAQLEAAKGYRWTRAQVRLLHSLGLLCGCRLVAGRARHGREQLQQRQWAAEGAGLCAVDGDGEGADTAGRQQRCAAGWLSLGMSKGSRRRGQLLLQQIMPAVVAGGRSYSRHAAACLFVRGSSSSSSSSSSPAMEDYVRAVYSMQLACAKVGGYGRGVVHWHRQQQCWVIAACRGVFVFSLAAVLWRCVHGCAV